MATETFAFPWRNMLIWSAVSAIFYILIVWVGALLLNEGGPGSILQASDVVAKLAVGLVLSAALVGYSSRNRPISLRAVVNYLILSLVAVAVCILLLWGFNALAGGGTLGAMDLSERIAAGVGLFLVFIAIFGMFSIVIARKGPTLMEPQAVEDVREGARMIFFSYLAVAAMGLTLILLSLGGPGGLVAPATALAGALLLLAITVLLSVAVWRLLDELGRTLSHETGNMAFYLIILLGGAWAMLAHLGYTSAPAPLDWLTMFSVLMILASIIAVGRRSLLAR